VRCIVLVSTGTGFDMLTRKPLLDSNQYLLKLAKKDPELCAKVLIYIEKSKILRLVVICITMLIADFGGTLPDEMAMLLKVITKALID